MISRLLALFSFALLAMVAAAPAAEPRLKSVAEGRVKLLDAKSDQGVSQAVIVEDLPLAHTAQLLPLDRQGRFVGEGDVTKQSVQVFKNLEIALSEAGSSLERVVKLNLYVADESLVASVRRAVAQTFRGEMLPAASLVVSRLPNAQALIAADAVGIVQRAAPQEVALHRSGALADAAVHAHAAVAPAGQRIYVSGQAEPGDLDSAVRKTLEGLRATLKFLGRTDRDVVQIKAFLTPMSAADDVRRIVAEFFGDHGAPPLVLVEWESTLPIEIELIAYGGPAAEPEKAGAATGVEFLTPPGMKASPVFSRVARIRGGPTIYVGGLYASEASAGAAAVEEIFATLADALKQTGSDFRHLAKATYYVAGEDVSRALNDLRPKYYDPDRPPAASKAMVRAVGRAGRTITLDMIATPAP